MAKIKHKPKLVNCPVKPKPTGGPRPGQKIKPSVEGLIQLTLLERAMDASLDPNDLLAASALGSDPGDAGETQQSNGVTFTAGSSKILSIKFGGTGAINVAGAEPGSQFFWVVNNGKLEGHLGNNANGPLAIILSIGGQTTAGPGNSATPTITATLTDAFPHLDGNDINNITITGIKIVATDKNNKKATADASVTVVDDVPDSALADANAPDLVVDESPIPLAGDGVNSATGDFSTLFQPVVYGADGPGTTKYSLDLSGTDVGSGLFALDATDIDDGDGDGYGQGDEILLNQDAITGVITGSVNATDYFTISINEDTGVVTFTRLANIWHSDDTNHDDAAVLTVEQGQSLQIVQTVTDGDGDTDSESRDISGGVFSIEDDGPRRADDTDSIASGEFGPATGNVITDASPGDVGDSDDGADIGSTDGTIIVVGVADGNTNADLDDPTTVGVVIQGLYGKLTLNADGSYSYTRDANTPGGVDDEFTYTVKDADGDLASTTLTISIGNSPPEITNLTPAANGGDTSVDEDDLLAARGVGESEGSDTSKETTTQGGTFNISAPDGVKSLTVGGVTVILNGVFQAPAPIVTGLGNILTITGYNSGTGEVSYTYELVDNENHAPGAGENSLFENFPVVLTDQDDQVANATLSVNIIDDVPTAVADTDSIPAGQFGPATGNVITDAEFDGGADTPGADGVTVVGVDDGDTGVNLDSPGTVGVAIQGDYGKLTLNSDGSYSYVRDPNTAGGVDDVFTYTIKDADGDLANTTLTISIGNSPPEITNLTPEAEGGDVTVDEDDLLASRGAGESEGSDTTKESTTQGGFFNISAPDGVDDLTVGGQAVITDGVFVGPVIINTPLGNVLTITAYNSVTGQVDYTYELTDNESHPNANGQNTVTEDFAVVLTDLDGQSANGTLTATVIDDVPTANDDGPVAVTEDTPISFDVFGNDVFGADGVDTDNNPTEVVTFTNASKGTVSYDAGTGQFTYTPDTGETGGDSFTYTIVDADGDSSTATVTLNIEQDSTPQIGEPDNLVVDEDGLAGANVDGAPLRPGETDSTESATQSGTVVVDFGSDVPANLLASIVLVDTGAPLDNQLQSLDGQNVIFALSGGDLVGTVDGGATEVIRIHIESAVAGPGANDVTYTYSATLSEPIKHAIAGQEDTDILSGVTFQVTDNDGSQQTGNFNVTVVDDIPTACEPDAGLLADGFSYNPQNGHYYKYVPGQFAWSGALTDASSNGGYLATITSAQENAFVFGLTPGGGAPWLGGSDPEEDGTWLWATGPEAGTQFWTGGLGGSAVGGSYANWRLPSEPSSDPDFDEDSLHFFTNASDWNDLNDADVTGFSEGYILEIGGRDGDPTCNSTVKLDDDDVGVNGNPGGVGDDAPSVASGTLVHSYGADGSGTLLLTGVNLPNATFFVSGNTGTLLTISQVQDGNNVEVLQVSLSNNTDGNYTVTQLATIDHPEGNNENNVQFDITYQVTDADGDTANSTFTVDVDDDTPTAVDDSTIINEGQQIKSDIVLTIDRSGSMAGIFQTVKDAVEVLFNSGSVNSVFLVSFSSDATFHPGPVINNGWFTDLNAAFAIIDGFIADGFTDYDAALAAVTTNFTAPPPGGSKLVSMYLSDGEPNESNGTGSNGIDEDDTDGNPAAGGEETDWINFLTDNDFDESLAFGFGGLGPEDVAELEPIAWTGVGETADNPYDADSDASAATDPNVHIVTDINDLAEALTGSISASASGNVLLGNDNAIGGGDDDSFGADGGRILSIQVGAIIYTYDPATGDITPSVGPAVPQNTPVLSVTTPEGGTLDFNFLTGAWEYDVDPNGVNDDTTETFTYVIVDADGDQSTADLEIKIINQPEPPTVTGVTVTATQISFTITDPDSASFDLVNTPVAFDTAFGNQALVVGANSVTPTEQVAALSGTLEVTDGTGSDEVIGLYLGTSGNNTGVTAPLASSPNAMYGFGGNDNLTGGTAGDFLFGGIGTDTLNGGNGNDTYFFGLTDGTDTINETGGTDHIVIETNGAALTALNISDSATDDDEGNLVITYNGNTITVVDHYDTDDNPGSQLETISFDGGSFAGYALPTDPHTLSPDQAGFNDEGAGLHVIASDAGGTTVDGGAGNDLLFGNDGIDFLIGGAGTDLLVGGGGDDIFDFNDVTESGSLATADVIADFQGAGVEGGDQFNFENIDTDPGGGDNDFTFGGSSATILAEDVIYFTYDGGNDRTIMQASTDANLATAEFVIILKGNHTLVAGDFADL